MVHLETIHVSPYSIVHNSRVVWTRGKPFSEFPDVSNSLLSDPTLFSLHAWSFWKVFLGFGSEVTKERYDLKDVYKKN